MTTQPTQPRPPNIAQRPNRKAPFADRLRRRAIVKTMCILGMRFKAGLRALTWSTVDPRRTSETIKLFEISRWAPYSLLARRPRSARLRAKTIHRRRLLTIGHKRRGQARQRVTRGRHVVRSSLKWLAWPRAPEILHEDDDESPDRPLWRALTRAD